MALLSYDVVPAEGSRPRLLAALDVGFPCNLACDGCGRAKQRGRPNRAAAVATAERVPELIDDVDPEAVSLVVFGGEPLLDADAVVCASSRVRDVCARRGCGYEGAVITNATLLDPLVARRLSRAGVTTVQVNLPVAAREAGRTSLEVQRFARVVRNVREAHDELDVVVRCAVDGSEDLREALAMVRILEREGVLSPPRPAAVLLSPPASYVAQARALQRSPAARLSAQPMPMMR